MENKNNDMPRYLYEARIIDCETDSEVVYIFGYSEEGLLEEMGKKKWTEAIKRHEQELRDAELQNELLVEEMEDELADGDELNVKKIEEALKKELEN